MTEIVNNKIAIVGNPNAGKSTVFNLLTGSNQVVGNWPGVTVERKEGKFVYSGIKNNVIDLPGIYSLSANSIDEKIARNFIVKDNPDLIVVVVDAVNLERNLYLVTQILELNRNVIIALNMMDAAESIGLKIDKDTLENILNIRIVPMVANRGKGIEELKKAIIEYDGKFHDEFDIFKNDKINNDIKEIENLIAPYIKNFPSRFAALRILEEDTDFLSLIIDKDIFKDIEKIKLNIENKIGEEIYTYIAAHRYGYIHGLYEECVEETIDINKRITLSDKIDKVLINRILGIPIFLFFLWLTFESVFKIGNPIAGVIDTIFGFLGDKSGILLEAIGSPEWIISLFKDGIIAGVGSVLVFFPNIFIMFLIFATLEDSGYMARAAFVMDKFMHKIGLHGKSFIPLILGFGCNVPAIMATRTLENDKDRIITILINPLMSCSARLPIYLMLTGIFFKSNQGTIVFSLYLFGVVLAVVLGRLFKTLFFRHKAAPLIMELPPYRLPSLRTVFQGAWNRSKLFVKKAGTIIFLGVVIIWLLSYLPVGVSYAGDGSLISYVGKFIAPIFKPAGYGFWQASVALLFGVVAKEIVVGAFSTLFGGTENLVHILPQYFTALSAYSFMLISLIYFPCIATIGVIKQEAGIKWALFVVVYSILLAYVVSVLFYQIGNLFI